MIPEKVYSYTRPDRRGITGSIARGDSKRFEIAKEQKDKFHKFKNSYKNDREMIDNIIKWVIEFLEQLDILTPEEHVFRHKNEKNFYLNDKNSMKFFYNELKKKYKLNDERHIVWIKFTKSGCLGVVAAGADINFDMKNTSGKIIEYVGEKWDEDFVLVFPLPQIGFGFRRDIECGIGNYLLSKGVPILDRYSHMY